MKDHNLDCQYCHKIFDINDMFTVDACCEEHQKLLGTKEFWGERPEIRRINTFYVVEHESKFGALSIKGVFSSFDDAMGAWNEFVSQAHRALMKELEKEATDADN